MTTAPTSFTAPAGSKGSAPELPDSPGLVTWQGHEGLGLDRIGEFDVIDCRACGFKHAVPLPSPEELRQIYREDYYESAKPLYLERFEADRDWWERVYADRYDAFERALARSGAEPAGRRLLDIGSGPGGFVAFGCSHGWDALGVEPSRQAVAYCREQGVPVMEGAFDETLAREIGGGFDVVHLAHVLEHIPDPAVMLRRAARSLAPGGLLCVTVPNDYSPFQRALREACGYRPWWLIPPHHLNFFDFAGLEHLFDVCGFDIVERSTSFPIDLFLLMGDDYVGNDELGRTCHGKRKRFEKHLDEAGFVELRRRLYQALADLDIGRDVVVLGRLRAHSVDAAETTSTEASEDPTAHQREH